MSKLEANFDALCIVLLLALFFGALVFTSVLKHILLFALPIIFLVKKLGFKASFIREIGFRKNKLLSIIVWQLFLIPVILGLVHGDFHASESVNLQWINHYNSWLILFCYLAANYFLHISETSWIKGIQGLTVSQLGLASFALAFVVDFFYSLIKWISAGLPIERWQASAGNPQLWAVQASLILVIYLLLRKNLNKLFAWLLLTLICAATILTGSISNFIGLCFASLAWIVPWAWLALVLVVVYLFVVNFATWNFLVNYQGEVSELKNIFKGFSHKFLPRIKLWFDLLKDSPNLHGNWVSGIGLDAYNQFLERATEGKHENVHSLYLHNWLINGIPGLYSSFIFLLNGLKTIYSNKYYLAIALYVLSSSAFDCALNFLEVQIPFWLMLPLIINSMTLNPRQGLA